MLGLLGLGLAPALGLAVVIFVHGTLCVDDVPLYPLEEVELVEIGGVGGVGPRIFIRRRPARGLVLAILPFEVQHGRASEHHRDRRKEHRH
jgi:hypothetical protein